MIKNRKILFLAAALVLAAALPVARAQTNRTDKVETKAQHDARMAWWRDAKFGLFIHWGVYAVPAGFYHDQPVKGIGEWIMNKGKIPMAEYQQFAKEFNPVKFNADDWVKAAKDAGMKYIVITSKHHDGFAMFCSQASPWNICDASPYGKDPLKDLVAACRKYDVKLGFYYSQAQDWNNGGSAAGGKWDKAQEHDMDEYIAKVAVPQVKEICSNYGEFPAVIWWDTPTGMNKDRAQKLYDAVQSLKPNVIMNNRLGGGFKGDTETPEQKIPAKGFPGRDWETCMTMNNTWGFKRDDDHWKSTEVLIRNLCDIASKGGNYLLNVGPTSEGLIPQPSLERLAEVGAWMKVNGEAIYGSSATVFGGELGEAVKAKDGYGHETTVSSANDWRCTTKPGKIYLIIFKWPTDGKFVLPGLQSKITKAYLLADRQQALKFGQTGAGATIDLPASAPDKIASVVCLEIADKVAKVSAGK
ncbi:MAG: alpha-L-fucosidase [Verrucomicrobiae bacterium]